MIRRAAIVCTFVLLTSQAALAQDVTGTDFSDQVHLQHCRVLIDGVEVAADAEVYMRDEDDSLYVSADQLDAWRLKHPPKPSFVRDGAFYYGLQTDLNLATSYDRELDELNIVARRTSFVGQPAATGPPVTSPGRGSFLNYSLMRQNGTYDFNAALFGGVVTTRYVSTAENGLEFHRARTRWVHLDPVHHTLLGIGEGTSGDNWLATSVPFAGIHFGSDFSSDPNYVGHEPLVVVGVAASPSLLEVFIDNILLIRRDVQQGPFTVRDLPQSAAYSDVVMVLTDANGKKDVQVARPVVDPDFFGKGKSAYAFNAGIGQENVGLRNTYYRHAVFGGKFDFGITNDLTAEVYAESINGENFIDAGADIRLGPDHTLEFRAGGGNKRRSGQVRYNLRRGHFQFNEIFGYNSLRTDPIEGEDFGVVTNISEATELSIELSRKWTLAFRLDRNRDSEGSNSSLLTSKLRYRISTFTFEISPFYDFVTHRTYGNMSVNFAVGIGRRAGMRSSVTNRGDTTAAIDYAKQNVEPGDPLSYQAQWSANKSQDRRFSMTEELPWASTNFTFQQQNGRKIYEPQVSGALAFLGGRIYALRTVSSSDSFGMVHVAGLPHAHVTVNDEAAGLTDARGDLLLKRLASFRDNAIAVSAEDVPLSLNVPDPKHVTPASSSPVAVRIPIAVVGSFTFHVVDDKGAPLPAGSVLVGDQGKYIVGYAGRVYVAGVGAGVQRFSSTAGGVPCTAQLNVPSNLGTVPDLGQAVCAHLSS
ncbi:MAG TPA: fimbria/pilus outer membrane usher protein [Candidatus Rubrimentiphilum sp.]|nr:fimbria/pilus outer membrane usher protein [Candidatus Rubrimentiphilum sp.]